MPEPANLVLITDATIEMMRGNPSFKKFAACLNSVGSAKPACGRCPNARAAGVMASNNDGVKQCLAGLRGATLTELKMLLNARQLRIEAKNGRGVKVKYTLK